MRKLLLLTACFALCQTLSGCLSVAFSTAKLTSSVISTPTDVLLGSSDEDKKDSKAKEESASAQKAEKSGESSKSN